MLISVAVVITATPLVNVAIFSAKSFAPPICPDKIGIAKSPFSSTTTTAGSLALSLTYGAIERTAIPHAPTNTIALYFLKISLTSDETLLNVSKPSVLYFSKT